MDPDVWGNPKHPLPEDLLPNIMEHRSRMMNQSLRTGRTQQIYDEYALAQPITRDELREYITSMSAEEDYLFNLTIWPRIVDDKTYHDLGIKTQVQIITRFNRALGGLDRVVTYSHNHEYRVIDIDVAELVLSPDSGRMTLEEDAFPIVDLLTWGRIMLSRSVPKNKIKEAMLASANRIINDPDKVMCLIGLIANVTPFLFPHEEGITAGGLRLLNTLRGSPITGINNAHLDSRIKNLHMLLVDRINKFVNAYF